MADLRKIQSVLKRRIIMKNRILKLVLGALVLAGLGFAGYRYMQQQDNVEIQSTVKQECKSNPMMCPQQIQMAVETNKAMYSSFHH